MWSNININISKSIHFYYFRDISFQNSILELYQSIHFARKDYKNLIIKAFSKIQAFGVISNKYQIISFLETESNAGGVRVSASKIGEISYFFSKIAYIVNINI